MNSVPKNPTHLGCERPPLSHTFCSAEKCSVLSGRDAMQMRYCSDWLPDSLVPVGGSSVSGGTFKTLERVNKHGGHP